MKKENVINKKSSSAYDPSQVEQKWYRIWEESGAFIASDTQRPPYAIMIPPPNITGALHMGHALNNTIQDIVIRMKRMQGYDALWLPGTDHAGIATQSVVEKKLRLENKTRHDLGREKFIEEVWKWREEYGNRILQQLRRLGCSCDWSRTRFTLDEGLSRAVREVFCALYDEGLIYRGLRIVNWCPTCHSAISDDEVEHRDEDGFLYEIRYPLVYGNEALVVATTRPETMFGDVAVAVHPDDTRWNKFIGKMVQLPLTNRTIPVIADNAVELDFGTGCLKITPAHDANDFEIGKRHQLEPFCVISTDGTMNQNAPEKYRGLDRFECRKIALHDLEQQGLLQKIVPYRHAVGHCYRTDDVIEPYLSEQWFVKMADLAQPALDAYRQGRVRFIPARYGKIYESWLENVRDWCISRQLWWGHRIPIWTCKDCGYIQAYRNDPKLCPQCSSTHLEQDPDVLDTWFSSQLWPFSTLGWPDQTADLKKWYPTNLLSTAREIIFFWVARMVMMGEKFMKDVPFDTVYIHGTVLDSLGRRMSKSLGNGIDPIDLIEEYGCDAVRFSLMMLNTEGQDIKLSPDKMEMGKHFANKIWNAIRFVYTALEDYTPPKQSSHEFKEREDRWILSRLQYIIQEVTLSIDEYRLREGALALYEFFWKEFCDWYLELIKPRLNAIKKDFPTEDEIQSANDAKWVMNQVVDNFLRLLHPYMPHISEELWQAYPNAKRNQDGLRNLLIKESWCAPLNSNRDLHLEETFELTIELVRNLRALRTSVGLTEKTPIQVICSTSSEKVLYELEEMRSVIIRSAKLSELIVGKDLERPKHSLSFLLPQGPTAVYVPLEGLVDIEAERVKAEKKLQELQFQYEQKEAQLQNENFIQRAKPHAIQVIVEARNRIYEQIQILKAHIDYLIK
ncbi:MAG: valine--tRNA ligase [bacterium]|nr:valine--tRNA ligase [bacterium]